MATLSQRFKFQKGDIRPRNKEASCVSRDAFQKAGITIYVMVLYFLMTWGLSTTSFYNELRTQSVMFSKCDDHFAWHEEETRIKIITKSEKGTGINILLRTIGIEI